MSRITTCITAVMLLAALLAVASCDKKTECEICKHSNSTEDDRAILNKGLNPIYIQLRIPGFTKSTAIEAIDLFAFEEGNGQLETWRHFSSIDQMEQSALAISSGQKTFVILVNAIEDFKHIENLSDLIEMKLDSRDRTLASRYWCVEDMKISGPGQLCFQVRRYQAIVNINHIKIDFADNVLHTLSIDDVKVGMLDVPSRISITGESDIDQRFNDGKLIHRELFKEIGTLNHGDIIECNASFMVVPKCDGIDEPENRAIRAAIYGLFNGKRRWWSIPVNMGSYCEQIYGAAGICSNTVYDLNITITGIGAESPYDNTSQCSLDIICNVQKWTEQNYTVVF